MEDLTAPTPKASFKVWWLVVAVIVVVLVAGGYFLMRAGRTVPAPTERAEEPVESALEVVTKGTLPEITPTDNPAEELPETNPVKKANPFESTYKNPFE